MCMVVLCAYNVCVCVKVGREGKDHREKKGEVMILFFSFPNNPLIIGEFKRDGLKAGPDLDV